MLHFVISSTGCCNANLTMTAGELFLLTNVDISHIFFHGLNYIHFFLISLYLQQSLTMKIYKGATPQK